MTLPPHEEWAFHTNRIGQRVLVFEELDSTNTFAASLSPQLATDWDGLVVVARDQTAGRGRFGRAWRSRPGSSVLMSVVLGPPPELRRPVVLTAWAAVAVAEAIRELVGVQARIKWPNDVLISGKKVCGILIEQGVGPGSTHDATSQFRTVVGIGLNLSQTTQEFTSAGLSEATSLAVASGTDIDLRTATGALVTHLDAEYTRLLAGERVAVEADWKWRIGLLGRQVIVELTDGTRVSGRLREMSFDSIELEGPDRSLKRIVPEAIEHVRLVENG
jgi:BirA family biotin operon repressor/biotin-[acetyl-CoA-carboxylase] ligase